MVTMRRFSIFLLTLVLIAVPVFVSAQSEYTSPNYVIDNVVLANIFVIDTEASVKPPNIGSRGAEVTDIRHNQATIEWTTDTNSSSTILYGTTSAYGFETGTSNFVKAHKITLFGLKPETLYHFKAVSTDPTGGKGFTTDKTFSTTAETSIKSIQISGVDYNKADIIFETSNYNQYVVEYGTTTRYGSSIANASSTNTTKHTVQLTSLSPGTEYHVRIKVSNDKGSEAESSDFTFTTIPLPVFTVLQMVPVSANTINVVMRTNTPTTKIVYYRQLDKPDAKELSVASSEFSIDRTATIENLIGETNYAIRVVIADQGGKQNTSSTQTVRTPRDTQPPDITDLQVTTARTADEITAIASWKTNEPASDKAEVIRKGQETIIDVPGHEGANDLTNGHTVIGNGLKPSTLYTLVAISKDAAGNEARKEITFRTPKATQSIFTLLAANFANAFGWVIDLLK